MKKILCLLGLGLAGLIVAAISGLDAFGQVSTGGSVRAWTNSLTFYVDPLGNNANDGRSVQRPKLTIQAALTAASGGTNVVDLQGGIYDVTTNVINLPNNVSLRNGTIKSMVNLDVYGVAVVPGNNSVIENLTIICNTNNVNWAGLGSRSTTIATPQKAFTNVVVRGVFIRDGSADCWFVDNTSICTADIYASKFVGYFDEIAGGVNNHVQSRFRFIGCTILNDGAFSDQTITFGQGTILNVASGQYELIGCYGITTNQQTALGLNGTGTAIVNVSGCHFQVNGTNGAAANVFYTGVTGNFVMNGTNVVIGVPSTVGNLLATTNITAHSFSSSGSAPTVVTNGFGAGTTATVSIMAGSTDTAMDLIVNAGGTGNINSNICFITFNQPFPNNKVPRVSIQQNGTGVYAGRFAYDRNSSTTNGIQIIAAGTAPTTATSYTNTIFVVQ